MMEVTILNKNTRTFLETYDFLTNIIKQVEDLRVDDSQDFHNNTRPMFWISPDKEYTKKQKKLFHFSFRIVFDITLTEQVTQISEQVIEFFDLGDLPK